MGQYHLTVNLDKKQFLDPHKLGDGLKLWEQANSEGGVCSALLMLLAVSNGRGGGDLHTFHRGPNPQNPLEDSHYTQPEIVGSWGGDRIAVIGDYAESTDLRPEFQADRIYTWCRISQQLRNPNPNYLNDYSAEDITEGRHWRDISEDMIPLLREFCDVEITGTGWREKRRIEREAIR